MGTHFFWDPVEDNIIEEYDDDGNVITDYTTEPGYHGAVISEHRDGHTYYHHHDANGNTLAITDENGNVIDTFSYTANGEVTERTGTTPTPFQFGGEHGYYTDPTTGEIMVRQRPLSAVTGRWLCPDPLGLFEDINLYRYVQNNPILLIDPSGLECVVCNWRRYDDGRTLASIDKRFVGNITPAQDYADSTYDTRGSKKFVDQYNATPTGPHTKVDLILRKSGKFTAGGKTRPPGTLQRLTHAIVIVADICTSDGSQPDCSAHIKELETRWVYSQEQKKFVQQHKDKVVTDKDLDIGDNGLAFMGQLIKPDADFPDCKWRFLLYDEPDARFAPISSGDSAYCDYRDVKQEITLGTATYSFQFTIGFKDPEKGGPLWKSGKTKQAVDDPKQCKGCG